MRVCSVCQRRHDSSVRCEVEGAGSGRVQELRTDLVPGYELLELTSSRRSCEIYRAREIGSQRTCCVKIISSDPDTVERLLSEATFAAGLFHPAIVDILEAGKLDGDRSYIVTEEAAGRTLREVLDDIGTPGLLETIDIIRQAADALHTLHQTGLFHRAISPSNIVLSAAAGGRRAVKLDNLDFGGTLHRAVISDKFRIDSELNTLKYFAPEQLAGDEADARTDVYSLGIVFYEMLAGAPPFDASTAVALVHQQKNQQPADVRIDNFNLRMLVTHALMESLQKRPSARQSSANLLARQLRHIEQLATHVTTPPPAGTLSAQPPVHTAVSVEMMPTRYVPPAPPTATVREPAMMEIAEPTVVIDSIEPVLECPPKISVAPPVADVPWSALLQTETEPVTIAETTVVETHAPRRSRLKGWKKRLHQLAAELSARAQEKSAEIVTALKAAAETTSVETDAHSASRSGKVEWFEDDIPSIEAVTKVLAKEGIEARFVDASAVAANVEPQTLTLIATPAPVVESAAVVAADITPLVAEIEPEPDPVPVVTDAPATKPYTGLTTVEPRQIPGQRKPSYIQFIDVEPDRVPDVADVQEVRVEPNEEITLVRPPRGRRIRVALDRAAPERPNLFAARKNSVYARQQKEFVPTLLGSRNDAAPPVLAGADAMFSMHPSTRATRSYRSTFIAMGIFGLTGLLLFGNDSVTRYFQTWTAADSVAGTRREVTASEPTTALKPPSAKKSERSRTPGRSTISERPSSETSASKTKLTASARPVAAVIKDDQTKPDSAPTRTRPRIVRVP
jgi:serine/threonine protein kinase